MIDRSNLFPPAYVAMGNVTVLVENTYDTERASHFRVQHPRKPGGDVTLDFKSGRYACSKCFATDCLHADAVRKFVAAQQPIDTGATGAADGSTRPF